MEELSFIETGPSRSRGAFLVPQEGARLIDSRQTLPRCPQAQVHVIVVVRKGRIHSAQALENLFADSEAGARDRRHISCERKPWPEIATIRRQSPAHMPHTLQHAQ